MPLTDDLNCPSCGRTTRTAVRVCDPCGVRIEGAFEPAGNEFSRLSKEELHLLRIFVHTEGSIREMESALGISYPTVKARLSGLRESLGMPSAVPNVKATSAAGSASPGETATAAMEAGVETVLQDMKTGRVSAADAARLIRELRKSIT